MTAITHLAFDSMVGLGTLLIGIAGLVAIVALRRHRRGDRPRIPEGRNWLRAAAITGPAAMLAMLAGWEVTESGRQPWIVYGRMRVSEAVTTNGGITVTLVATIILYLSLAAALILILRRMATGGPSTVDSEPAKELVRK